MLEKMLKSFKRFLHKYKMRVSIIMTVVLVSVLGYYFFSQHKIPPYDRLTQALNSGEYSRVIEEGEPYLEDGTQDEKLVILMARAYFAYGVLQNNREAYANKALALLDGLSKKSLLSLTTKGYIYFSLHNFDGARLAYKEALAIDGKSIESMVKLAQVYEASKNIGEAEKLYKKVLELDPGNHEAIIGHLRMKVIYKEYDFVFKKATDLLKYARDSDFIASLSELLATEYGRRKDFDNAEKMYREVIRRQPMRVASLVGLADTLVKTVYKKILQEGSGNSIESLTEESKTLAEKAVKIDKDFIYSYLVLLDVERLRGHVDQAQKYEDIAQKLFISQKFLASERDLIKARLSILPKAKITVTK